MAALKELFATLENEVIKEYEIYQKLITIDNSEHHFELEAEKLAFSISDQNTIIGSDQGLPEYERVRILDNENLESIISYWRERSKKTKNPIMKFRYCKLYLEFFSGFKNIKFDKSVVEDLVNAIIVISNLDENPFILHTLMYQLNYAVYVSIKFNQNHLVSHVKKTILSYCERLDLIENQGIWHTIYFMLLRNIEKTHLKNDEIEIILTFLNKLLEIEKSPYEIIRLSDLICEYYKKCNEHENVETTLDKAFDRLTHFKSSGLGISNLFLGFQSIVKKYQYKKLALVILKKIEENGKEVLKEMHPTNISIPPKIQEGFKKWKISEHKRIENLLKNNSFDEIVISLTLNYLPRKADIQKDKEKNSSLWDKLPGIVVQSSVDKDGVPVLISDGFENENLLLVKWMVERTLIFSNNFFHFSMSELFSKYTYAEKSISNLINQSNLFSNRHKLIILRAIKAYFENDFIVAIHLFIPQIEDILRNLMEINGGNIRKPNEYGGFDKKLLYEVLTSYELISFLGEDIILYFNSILCHRFGYNVRNQVCHGFLDDFDSIIALRLLHIILLLTMIEVEEEDC